MLYTLIENAKPKDDFYFFGTNAKIYPELQEKIYLAYDKLRKEKRLNVFGIHHSSIKPLIKKGRHPKMKYVNFPIPQTMVIFCDKIAIISWNNLENPAGILITSKEIAQQYKEFFLQMWSIAKN